MSAQSLDLAWFFASNLQVLLELFAVLRVVPAHFSIFVADAIVSVTDAPGIRKPVSSSTFECSRPCTVQTQNKSPGIFTLQCVSRFGKNHLLFEY